MVESLQKLLLLSHRNACELIRDFNVSFSFSTRPKRDMEKLSVFRIVLPIKSLANPAAILEGIDTAARRIWDISP